MTPFLVRDAGLDDAPACAAIYEPYVTGTAVTFETAVPTVEDLAARIDAARASHAWLVAERDGRVVGYAYAGPFAARPAYRWSCEVTVYGEFGVRRTGVGRALYQALLPRLADRGYRTAVAKITLPNAASTGLHVAFGFEPVGVHRDIGFKLGAWHDVAISQRPLRPAPPTDADPPPEPR